MEPTKHESIWFNLANAVSSGLTRLRKSSSPSVTSLYSTFSSFVGSKAKVVSVQVSVYRYTHLCVCDD